MLEVFYACVCAGVVSADHTAFCNSLTSNPGLCSLLSACTWNGVTCQPTPCASIPVVSCVSPSTSCYITNIDCADSACNAGGSLSITDAELARYNCLGTSQTGDKTGLTYYCGSPVGRDDVGLCCPVGQEPVYDSDFNVWYCRPTSPCYPEPAYQCGVTYSAANFNVWRQDVGCLNPSTPEACCSVVKFGATDYYSDMGNVVIY